MASPDCVVHNWVGKSMIGPSGTKDKAESEDTTSKEEVVYQLGNNEAAVDYDDAADKLLWRSYEDIAKLKTISKEEFIPGKIGVRKMPNPNQSEIPKVAEPKDFQSTAQKKPSSVLKIGKECDVQM